MVYPHHGAVTITGLTTRNVKGTPTKYMALRVHSSDLVIQAAIETAADLGVRDVIDQAGVHRGYDLLRVAVVEEATNWSRWFKDNQAKMLSGDVYKVAEVVRDVWRREQDKGISVSEKEMLSRARQILVSELALANKTKSRRRMPTRNCSRS
ncbi:CarD family transcriptional regulator [Frigoribacterium sp. PhB24]|uniref:CarD family transcriptional regulator n=1 Tax=Frigoribacterium sp. PhB24 TaxID=2485204 RepID=UPI000F4683A9|nr:CarD family transcriptional regulator [Frigoribacterium sp. PhB24]ROS47941.1 CarD family transcriptional regulator [Frigoribacterium sp. PhB24]